MTCLKSIVNTCRNFGINNNRQEPCPNSRIGFNHLSKLELTDKGVTLLTTRLIINADDYGRSPGISRGIRHAHLHGIVTSTTCMMNMPAVMDELKIALQDTPHLGLGVHLVITTGKPLLRDSKIAGLTGPDGNFLNKSELIGRVQDLQPASIKAEWQAQIEAFIKVAGRKPSHLDSHHHSAYFTPALLTKLFELAREYDLPLRLPLAHSYPARGKNPEAAGIPEEMEEAMAEFAPQFLEQFQPRSPDAFFASFFGEQATRGELIKIMGHFLPNGTFEIMCHPGYVDEAFARESTYTFQREEELKILTDPAMRMEIQKRGIELISFEQL